MPFCLIHLYAWVTNTIKKRSVSDHLIQTYSARALRTLGLLLADRGWGRLFGVSAGFSAKTTVIQKQKVKKLTPRCEMCHLSDGYKWAIDKIWGPTAEKRILGPKTEFSNPKIRFIS